jgi:hypothetical protein
MAPSVCSSTISRSPEIQHSRWWSGSLSGSYAQFADLQNKLCIAAVIGVMGSLADTSTCDLSEPSMSYGRSRWRCSRLHIVGLTFSDRSSFIVHRTRPDVVVEMFSGYFKVEKQYKRDELEMRIEVYVPITMYQFFETMREFTLKSQKSSISIFWSLFSVHNVYLVDVH